MANIIDASTLDLTERVVAINRVSKTVKGGRIFKFSAIVQRGKCFPVLLFVARLIFHGEMQQLVDSLHTKAYIVRCENGGGDRGSLSVIDQKSCDD